MGQNAPLETPSAVIDSSQFNTANNGDRNSMHAKMANHTKIVRDPGVDFDREEPDSARIIIAATTERTWALGGRSNQDPTMTALPQS